MEVGSACVVAVDYDYCQWLLSLAGAVEAAGVGHLQPQTVSLPLVCLHLEEERNHCVRETTVTYDCVCVEEGEGGHSLKLLFSIHSHSTNTCVYTMLCLRTMFSKCNSCEKHNIKNLEVRITETQEKVKMGEQE